MKRLLTTAVLVVLLVTIVAGIALAYLAPVAGPGGVPGIGGGTSAAACGPAATSAIERPLDRPAHRLAWSTGPRVGAWQVVVADADGTNRITLTSGNTFHGEPAWSPDGTKVAFVQRDDKEVDHIWIAEADGANARLLVPEASSPSWSPDGTRIAYWSGGDASIGMISVLQPVPIRLVGTEDLGAFERQLNVPSMPTHMPWGRPAWSPDGTRIVFAVIGPDPARDLAISSLGGQVLRLTDTPGCDERGPAWSPDGSRILFTADAGDGVPADLFAVSPDGTGRERLTATGDRSEEEPAVSPDGRSIAVGLSLEDGQRSAIAVLNADGTGAQQVMLDGPGNASGNPAWIP